MKRYELPGYIYNEVKERVGTGSINLTRLHSRNVENARELRDKVLQLWETVTGLLPYIRQFPEAVKPISTSYDVGIGYDEVSNTLWLVTPVEIGDFIPLHGLPTKMSASGRKTVIDVTKMDITLWTVLLDRIAREATRWVEYLEDEV